MSSDIYKHNLPILLQYYFMWHKQGNAGEQPDACHGLYGKAAGFGSVAFQFTGKPKAVKLRGLGQSPRASLLHYAMLSVINPHIKHASSLAIAVAATFLFVPLFNTIR